MDVYIYTFSLTLQLTTILLQKLLHFSYNILFMEFKDKNYEMGQNIHHCCYGDYVTANQQIQINKACWLDFASLPSHIVFKNFIQFINLLFVIGFPQCLAKCLD